MRMITIDLRRRPEFGPSRQFDQGSDYDWFKVQIIGPICEVLDIRWDYRSYDLITHRGGIKQEPTYLFSSISALIELQEIEQ